ncbi:uncharacterized protein LOC105398535 [Plutella xylostella]|uniref:uncharacterized protein LOC105398535 n=1 Tax=Plutella xylostella TaxID=51655 RepID=UPI002032BB00|nr:uncharacterized protein LOC105398535 [Plutella xylostella]
MATTGIGFRWLDLLEKEFDKACVELDTSLADVDSEEPEVVFNARQKIATLGSCFAQLTHKALTIFQNSVKLEAELVDMRAELVQARAVIASHKDSSLESPASQSAVARAEAQQLARENAALRETVLALHSELFGARLATKYLDKELAGRIQQLQLLGRDMRAELRDSLWAQVEAEILLQRHKTLVRVCRGVAPRGARPPAPRSPAPRSPRAAPPRSVRVRRDQHLGLGISVTGGREHGVPILISELEAGGPAALTGELFVGDAILAINDVDLTQACHKEAVQALQSVKGDCALCVQFIATDDDDRLSEDNYRFPLYPEDGEFAEADGSGATPTAPRTPDYTHRPRSEAGSGSECESPAYAEARPAYSEFPPEFRCNTLSIVDLDEHCIKVEEVEAAVDSALDSPVARDRLPEYKPAEYRCINNSLSIVDLDEHSIKVEALAAAIDSGPDSPVVVRDRACVRRNGAYRGVAGSSSADSPASTPVHAARGRRRRPRDWRSKGTYRPVDDDAQSSDETRPSRESSPVNGHGISTVFDKPAPPPPAPVVAPAAPVVAPTAPVAAPTPPVAAPAAPPPRHDASPPTRVSAPPSQQIASPPINLPKQNGLDTKTHKSKGFRIGTAKRVLDAAPRPAPLSNGARAVHKYPQILAGDGDPDFGTPV